MVKIGNKRIGYGERCYLIAEIGINHNGSVENAVKLIDVAKAAGCDAVKFQKREPELAVPESHKNVIRETPWGNISYIDYKRRIEFGSAEYDRIALHCAAIDMIWFASVWDEPSLEFLLRYDVPCIKIPSACLTNEDLCDAVRDTDRPVILSTGMSTMSQIRSAVWQFDEAALLLAHCTSTYPCVNEELNLRVIRTLQKEFNCVVGYSGHEVGLQTTIAAFMLGAAFIERHITLNRSQWGSDHGASIEPLGLARLVRNIRVIELALGDGEKRVYDSEKPVMAKLRR